MRKDEGLATPIDADEVIAGLPALEVRRLCKRLQGRELTTAEFAAANDMGGPEALRVLNKLKNLQITLKTSGRGLSATWGLGRAAGLLFGTGRGVKNQFKRETADQALAGLKERIAEVNSDPYYLYYVARAAVFGSHLTTDRKRVGDLDVAVKLVSRVADRDESVRLSQSRSAKASWEGVSFPNYTANITFAYNETLKALIGGDSAIKLTYYDEIVRHGFEHREIYKADPSHIPAPGKYPDSLHPLFLRAGHSIEATAVREVVLAGGRIPPDTLVSVTAREPWALPPLRTSEELTACDWRTEIKFPDRSLFFEYSNDELLAAAFAISRGWSQGDPASGLPIYHSLQPAAESLVAEHDGVCPACRQGEIIIAYTRNGGPIFVTCADEPGHFKHFFELKPKPLNPRRRLALVKAWRLAHNRQADFEF